jgi:hypothetical protein
MELRANKIFLIIFLWLLGFSNVGASEVVGSMPSHLNNFLTGTVQQQVVVSPSNSPLAGGGSNGPISFSPTPSPKIYNKFSTAKGKISAKVLNIDPRDIAMVGSGSEVFSVLSADVSTGSLSAIVRATSSRRAKASTLDEPRSDYVDIVDDAESVWTNLQANILDLFSQANAWQYLLVSGLSSLGAWLIARWYYVKL